MIARARPAADAAPVTVALHLSPSGDGVADWHPVAPRGGWTLDAAEDAALTYASDDSRLAARAYGVLVRATSLGRPDMIARIQGDDRVRRILDRNDDQEDRAPF